MSGDSQPAATSYPSVLHTLNNLGERAKKHRRSSTSFLGGNSQAPGADRSREARSVFDNVLADAEQLLFSLKHHSMHSDSASSRVMEAQAWMHKAAIEKAACRAEDEAAAYLTAAALWTAIEAERKALNVLTSGDALARGVLCCAMGCNVLLTIKPNIATSPLPMKLTKMVHHHISKCWAVCVRVASLLSDFGCYEMSADYYELAAILVTMDAPPASSAPLHSKRTVPSQARQPASATTAVDRAHVDPTAASSSSACGDAAPTRGASMLRDAQSSSPTTSSIAGPSRTHIRRGQQLGQGSPTHSVRSRITTGTASVAGGGLNHNRVFRAGERVFSGAVYGELRKGTPPMALILNGFMDQYLVALSSCAMTCALTQDYPRCISVVDDLLMHVVGVETARRPPELSTAWIRRILSTTDADGDNHGTPQAPVQDDDARTTSRSFAPATGDPNCVDHDDDMLNVDATRTALFTSIVLDDDEGRNPYSEGDGLADNVSRPSPSTETPHDAANDHIGGGASSVATAPVAAARTERSSATPSSAVPTAAAFGAHTRPLDQHQQEQQELLQRLPLAPPPGGSLHAHAVFSPLQHLFFLMEVDGVVVQMRLVKVLCLIALRDPVASHNAVRDEIAALRGLASLHRAHERKTRFCGPGGHEAVPMNGAVAASDTFSAGLFRLCATLDTMEDIIERYPIATTRREKSSVALGHRTIDQENTMRVAFEEVNLQCKELGMCSRNLVVLLERARRAVIGL